MTPLPDFLQPLEFVTRPFPRGAVAAAIDRREEAIPHLLQALEWADQHTDEANSTQSPYMLHLFALFLLAQFRETRACPLIVGLARNPGIDDLTGDVVTENLGSILASVCGGDTASIEGLIEDPSLDEFVRGAAVTALGVLLHTGAKTREQVSAYLGALFASRHKTTLPLEQRARGRNVPDHQARAGRPLGPFSSRSRRKSCSVKTRGSFHRLPPPVDVPIWNIKLATSIRKTAPARTSSEL